MKQAEDAQALMHAAAHRLDSWEERVRQLTQVLDTVPSPERRQQAEKDFRTAEYYERTGHPGSAVFCYELVRRRYAGTKYADIAGRTSTMTAALREPSRSAEPL